MSPIDVRVGRAIRFLRMSDPSEVRLVLLEYRADWLQLMATFGFPAANQLRFCWQCDAEKSRAYEFEQAWGWRERTHESFMAELASIHVHISVNRASAATIWDALQWDHREKDGLHGRVLSESLDIIDANTGDVVRLQRRDRLEALGDLRDVYDEAAALPEVARLVFFRKRADVWLGFVPVLLGCPFFKFEFIVHDVLHTLDLGVSARLAGHTIAQLLRCGAFGSENSRLGFERGLRTLNRALRVYVRTRKQEYRQQLRGSFSCYARITLGLLGLGKQLL